LIVFKKGGNYGGGQSEKERTKTVKSNGSSVKERERMSIKKG